MLKKLLLTLSASAFLFAVAPVAASACPGHDAVVAKKDKPGDKNKKVAKDKAKSKDTKTTDKKAPEDTKVSKS